MTTMTAGEICGLSLFAARGFALGLASFRGLRPQHPPLPRRAARWRPSRCTRPGLASAAVLVFVAPGRGAAAGRWRAGLLAARPVVVPLAGLRARRT